MTKSELIELLARSQGHLKADDVDVSVKTLLELMSTALAEGERIEIRVLAVFLCIFAQRALAATPRLGSRLRFRASTCRTSSPARNCVNA